MSGILKVVLCLVIGTILMQQSSFPQEIRWTNDFEAARRDAYMQHKLLLLYFGDFGSGALGHTLPSMEDPRVRMEEEVWKDTSIVRMSQQYICVKLGFYPLRYRPQTYDGALSQNRYDRLIRLHHIVDLPTTLVTDPVGNELIRVVGLVNRSEIIRGFRNLPVHLDTLYRALEALEAHPDDAALLVAAGHEYRKIDVPALSNRYYESEAVAGGHDIDSAMMESVDYFRSLNYSKLGDPGKAATILERQLDLYPWSNRPPAYLLMLAQLYVKLSKEELAKHYVTMLNDQYLESQEAASARALLNK